MALQPDSFNLLDVIRVREEAIQRADQGADRDWKAEVTDLLFVIAQDREYITVDDLREKIVEAEQNDPDFPQTHNRSALGPVMRQGYTNGWIEPTGATEPSRSALAHSKPQRIWKSLVKK